MHGPRGRVKIRLGTATGQAAPFFSVPIVRGLQSPPSAEDSRAFSPRARGLRSHQRAAPGGVNVPMPRRAAPKTASTFAGAGEVGGTSSASPGIGRSPLQFQEFSDGDVIPTQDSSWGAATGPPPALADLKGKGPPGRRSGSGLVDPFGRKRDGRVLLGLVPPKGNFPAGPISRRRATGRPWCSDGRVRGAVGGGRGLARAFKDGGMVESPAGAPFISPRTPDEIARIPPRNTISLKPYHPAVVRKLYHPGQKRALPSCRPPGAFVDWRPARARLPAVDGPPASPKGAAQRQRPGFASARRHHGEGNNIGRRDRSGSLLCPPRPCVATLLIAGLGPSRR